MVAIYRILFSRAASSIIRPFVTYRLRAFLPATRENCSIPEMISRRPCSKRSSNLVRISSPAANASGYFQQLEQDKESLLSRYANLVPRALGSLDEAQCRQVYGMLRVEAAIEPDGSLEVRGDVISVSEEEILSV
jgi:hypothetical protein